MPTIRVTDFRRRAYGSLSGQRKIRRQRPWNECAHLCPSGGLPLQIGDDGVGFVQPSGLA